MLTTVDFHLKPLPGSGIWTGSDESTRMTALKGTSLIGSMRFWTEALLRSFGHRVCDCTAQHENFDRKDYERGQDGKVCAACHSFGCTGLARAFNLHVVVKTQLPEQQFKGSEKKCVTMKDIPDRGDAKYSFATGWTEELTLSISCRRPLTWPCEEHRHQNHVALPPEMLLATFLMLEYGTLGAMDQYGLGLVELLNREDLVPAIENCLKCVKKGSEAPQTGYASLQDFYFFKGILDSRKLREKAGGYFKDVSNSFDNTIRVRRLIREGLRSEQQNLSKGEKLRHWICGFQKEPTGSHICIGVSNSMLHGWGWVPRTGIADLDIQNWQEEREKILQKIFTEMNEICTRLEWREFCSQREENAPQDWSDYMQKMIVTPWRSAL